MVKYSVEALMGQQGSGNNEPPAILKRLQRLYGHLSLEDLYTVLLHLNDTMDSNEPAEVMIWAIEEVKMFLFVSSWSQPRAGRQEPHLVRPHQAQQDGRHVHQLFQSLEREGPNQ